MSTTMASTQKQNERIFPAKQQESNREKKDELFDKNIISSLAEGMEMKASETGSNKNRKEREAGTLTTEEIIGSQTTKPGSIKSPSITDNLSPKISGVTTVPIVKSASNSMKITSEKIIVPGSGNGIKISSTASILPTTSTSCSQTAAASKATTDNTKITVTLPKHFHLKTHSQKQQQPQHQHRYSRQNQEEAVFKMVQNIFKLLETRGPLTIAQLEYNLPILIMGSSTSKMVKGSNESEAGLKTSMPTSTQVFSTLTNTTTLSSQQEDGSLSSIAGVSALSTNKTSTTPSFIVNDHTTACDSNNRGDKIANESNVDNDIPNNDYSMLYEHKLIPENMVPEIIELLVTLGLIQQEAMIPSSVDAATATATATAEETIIDDHNHYSTQVPRFAVHFGQPRQFPVTPSNIMTEIAKAQGEIQASRQRQELLKEALDLPDQQAAEKVKHIVLQHPQVVDDPVYVTALRNLQVDGMLMAGGTSGTANLSSSINNPVKTGTSGRKRVQSSCGTQAKRKRRRSKKESVTDCNSVVKTNKDDKVTSATNIISDTALSTKTSFAGETIHIDTTNSAGPPQKP